MPPQDETPPEAGDQDRQINSEAALKLDKLSVTYGSVQAVKDVDLEIKSGTIVGLIGPNGAGKTSLIDAVTGFAPSTGWITFFGESVTDLAPHVRARRGLARTWQTVELFDVLTVRENLLVSTEANDPQFRWPGRRRAEKRQVETTVDEVAAELGLNDALDASALELSQGQRKLVGLGRALVARPRLLLADEPAAGLDSTESAALAVQLRQFSSGGLSILLVDHDMSLVLSVCDYVYVLDFGRILASGRPSEIRSNPVVISAYLGEDERAGASTVSHAGG